MTPEPLPDQIVWTAYVCSICGYRTFSAPNSLPCVRCLHHGQRAVKVAVVSDASDEQQAPEEGD